MHVCTIQHANGQAEGTILMVCTVLACNLSLQLTRVSILQVFPDEIAVLSVMERAKL